MEKAFKKVIAFTNNSLSGDLPNGLCKHLTILRRLDLSKNKLDGHMPKSLSNCSKLQILSLSENDFDGRIHSEIGRLSNLQTLDITSNHYTGEIPKINNLVELEEFDVGFNSFSGSLAMETFNKSRLRIISLAYNNISGTLPSNIGSILPNVEELYLNSLTNLVGTIPHSISNCSKLTLLELSDNKLTDLIPNSLGYLTRLQALNPLNGMLPVSAGNLSTSLTLFYAHNCKIKGRIPNEVGNLSSLLDLDLSGNNLVGSIPRTIGNLQNIQRFKMSDNKLIGFIEDNICLEFLDISHNNISGIIPMSLEKLQYLDYFNVSFNKLRGEIPSRGPFKNLSSQFFINNEALCGLSRFNVPPCPTSLTHRSNRKMILLVLFLLLGIALVLVPIVFLFLWIRYRRGKRAPQQADSLSMATTERISYYELLQATDSLSESNLIGSGSFGSVYKGVLRSGTAIAVKVFNLQLEAAFKSFDTECEVLRSLRHRNLVKVITSCSNLDFKALVLEYMPNGSLEKYLYSHNYFLDIRQRLSIMIDVACALEYFHHGCSSPVIHCDLKPSNVLLDEDMVAHLSDFGISKLLSEDESDLYTKTLATFGYIAPGTSLCFC
ncbi:receptor kinase-like protein Xa21 [Solanum stenotomum]|uniref:receptor kinase-like protein Xa21 n=1 Tax=Solanum stenotomum TaxID=172797 RepID=UPI0020D1E3DD|nr:receptor kinase-like protein Xa21 [Solanum stenotomum]